MLGFFTNDRDQRSPRFTGALLEKKVNILGRALYSTLRVVHRGSNSHPLHHMERVTKEDASIFKTGGK